VKLVLLFGFIINKRQSGSTVQCLNLRPGSPIATELTVQITVLVQLYPGHKTEQGHKSVPQAIICLALQWVNGLRAKTT